MIGSNARKLSWTRHLSRTWGDLSKIRPKSPLLSIGIGAETSPEDGLCFKRSLSITQPQQTNYSHKSSDLRLRSSAIRLRGLDYGYQRAIDFYQPVIREFWKEISSVSYQSMDCIRYPPAIEPIDTVTMWKGLTLGACDTLLFIQGHLKVCLERLLEDQFASFRSRLLKAWQSDCQESSKESDYTETLVPHRFLFKKDQLIQAMSEAFEMLPVDLHDSEDDRWFEKLLMLYIWSRDCFKDLPYESNQTAIKARLPCYVNSAACFPPLNTIEASWTPDRLTFERLDVLPEEGSEVVIKPCYRPNASHGAGTPHTQITYSLGTCHPWLRWDERTSAFRGHVPHFSKNSKMTGELGQVDQIGRQGLHATVHVVRVELKALVVVAYPGFKTCIERTIRSRVTLRVLPPASTPELMVVPKDPSQSHIVSSDHTRSHTATLAPQQHPKHDFEKISVAVDPKSDENLTLTSTEDQRSPNEPVNCGIFEKTASAKSTLKGHQDSIGASPSSFATRARKPSLPVLQMGLRERPNGRSSWSGTGNKSLPAKQTFSNVPGISLQALATIMAHPNESVLREAQSATTNQRKALEDLNNKENEHLTLIEALDAKHKPRRDRRPNRMRNRFDATPPKSWKAETIKSPTDGPQIKSFQPPMESLRNKEISLLPEEVSPNPSVSEIATQGVRKREIRSAIDLHASLRRRQAYNSKASKNAEDASSTKSPDGQESRQHTRQVIITDSPSPTLRSKSKSRRGRSSTKFTSKRSPVSLCGEIKVNSAPPATPKPNMSHTPPRALGEADQTPQTVILSNRYAPLQDLFRDWNDRYRSDNDDFQLFLSNEQHTRVKRKGRQTDSACYVEDVFMDDTKSNASPVQQEDRHISKSTISKSKGSDPSGKKSKHAYYNMTTPTRKNRLSMPVLRSTSMGWSRISAPSLPPSPPASTGGSAYDEGGDPYTSEEKRLMQQLSMSKEAIKACREPGLSKEEIQQMYWALREGMIARQLSQCFSAAEYGGNSDDEGVAEEVEDGKVLEGAVNEQYLEKENVGEEMDDSSDGLFEAK